MKFKEIQKLTPQDREKKLKDIRIELLKLQGQVQTGTTPKSPGQIKELKRSVARIKTLETQEAKTNKN
jgi:large subunit ribosomal protein L29